MNTKRIFYITSYFHLLIVDSIIEYENLPEDSFFFVTSRGLKLPQRYSDKLLYDSSLGHFKYRVDLYKKEKKRFQSFFKDSRVVIYSPYQLTFPDIWYFDEYHFFEEGFSAYTLNWERHVPFKAKLVTWSKVLLINIFFPFANKKIKGLILGNTYTSLKLRKKANLYGNDKAFVHYHLDNNLKKVSIPIAKHEVSCDINNSIILVCDCLSGTNRHLDSDKYLLVLQDTLSNLDINGKSVYVKLHPSDYKNEVVLNKIKSVLPNSVPEFINDNLEEIAVADRCNTFVGTSSTILFFAPMLGKSNKSISFARILAEKDDVFERFLNKYGSVEKFVVIFSQNADCL